MKIRGFLATAAAALVCCFTLGCPPAENDMPEDVDVVVPADSNTTETAPVVDETADPAADPAVDEPVVEEVPADEAE